MSRRSRRTDTQPKYTADEAEMEQEINVEEEVDVEIEDKAEEEEESEVTRCVCGRAELDAETSDSGFFIQCEGCSVWQHGICVGIPDEDVAPDTYWCELCRPQMHTLWKDTNRIIRSKYDPNKTGRNTNGNNSKTTAKITASETTTPTERASAVASASATGVITTSSSRTRQDPRDHHYETMLKRALEESARESNNSKEAIKSDPALNEGNEFEEKEIHVDPAHNVVPIKEPKPRKSFKKSSASKVTKPSVNNSTENGGFKANIPASRISMGEMTRRVYAIMEFLANIQTNLNAEDKFRDTLQQLDDKNFDRSVRGMKEDLVKQYNGCVQGVDDLMSIVNDWVETYDL